MTFQEGIALKTAPYLSVEVLEPSNFDKMKVGPALNVFSKATSAGLMEEHQKVITFLQDIPAIAKRTRRLSWATNVLRDIMCSAAALINLNVH